VTALVLYLAVALGCALSAPRDAADGLPPASPAGGFDGAASGSAATVRRNTRAVELPLRGVAMQVGGGGWVAEYNQTIDRIAQTGADALLLVVNGRMENGSSSQVYLDMRYTPTPEHLGQIIDHAKGLKLRVVLMPILLLDKPRAAAEWRGTINPEDWDAWWESYRWYLHHYYIIAEAHKVDVLSVGSELVSTEPKTQEWRKTIDQVRQHFKGMLTYSANWDHYKDIPFWDQLDLVAMNSYWTLGESREGKVSVQEIEQRWSRIKQNLLAFLDRVHKPLLFMEVGWCSLQNAAKEPWDYTLQEVPLDLDLQRKLYEGFFKSWHGVPQLGGFMIWEWTPVPYERGYTPEGKPAEAVLREWLAKKPWSVK
jgi:hypothetical protein